MVGTEMLGSQQTSNTTRERNRLFLGICLALLPTSFSFVLVSNILQQLKTDFILTNSAVGFIGGAALWGMAASLLLIGPFLEHIGLKGAVIVAFVCQLLGVTLFLLGYQFAGQPFAMWILFLGAIGFGAGNGFIEMGGNPLVAALYPEQKVTKLNHFHAVFPAGMIVGGLLGYFMAKSGTFVAHWTWQIALIYIPILLYGSIVLPLKFPKTETAEHGIPIGEIFQYVLTRRLIWALFLLEMVTLTLEQGPGRWIPAVLESAGVSGILVFVWISFVMMVFRASAGPFVKKLSPPGLLLAASILTAVGLYMFAFIAKGMLPLLLAGTVFAVGTAYYFPTMVGLMSERFPRAGSLGIVLMIGIGYIGSGASNAVMGSIADGYMPGALDQQTCVSVLRQVEERFPRYVRLAEEAAARGQASSAIGYRPIDARNALMHASTALSYYNAHQKLDGRLTGNALRAVIDSGIPQERGLIEQASALLRPADNYGGRMAFFWVAPLGILAAVVFLIILLNDRRRGGYKAVRLGRHESVASPSDKEMIR